MKSAKVINKILLISLAFGSITLVAGMLANGKLKNTLIGLGATTSVVSIAGTLVNKGNKSNGEQDKIQYEDNSVAEVRVREEANNSLDETSEMHGLEANTNSFQIEHNQLLGVDPNLNSQKEELETEHTSNQQENEVENIENSVIEDRTEEIELDNSNLGLEIPTQTADREELEESFSPIEESFSAIDAEEPHEIFTNKASISQESDEKTSSAIDSVETEINPFASPSDLSEPDKQEEASNLEISDKLFGAFDPTELDSDELLIEEDDADELESESTPFVSETESPFKVVEPEESVEELVMEDDSPEELSFGDESDSSINELVTEGEPSAEFSFSDEPAIASEENESPIEAIDSEENEASFESMPMDELVMEDESPEEFSFDSEPAIASETESPMDELVMEDDSSEEFSFSEESELDSPVEAQELSFEAMPMVESESPMDELVIENDSSEEFSFDDESAIASKEDEFSFDDEPAIASEENESPIEAIDSEENEASFESMPMDELVMEDESPEEFSFSDEPAIASEENESPLEAMPMAESESLMDELVMENDSSEEFSFDDESEENEVSFESMPMDELVMEDDSSKEWSFDSESESSINELVTEGDSSEEFNFSEESELNSPVESLRQKNSALNQCQ